MGKIHFSELLPAQVAQLRDHCVNAAIEYTDSINMGGLSEAGSHNIYRALEHALFGEWEKARALKALLNQTHLAVKGKIKVRG